MGDNLMQANREWSTRPEDERFTSLPEMYAKQIADKQASVAKVLDTRHVKLTPVDDGQKDHRGLALQGPTGALAAPSHWAFGQVCALAGAPAGYFRESMLPAPVVADCVNWGLANRSVEEIQVLVRKQDDGLSLRAATGPNYGRIWNAQVTKALIDRFGDGATGQWKVPGEFSKDVVITKQNTTLFAGDRDMFVFLADEKNRIEIPNRRDGKPGTLARGFFVRNSEVGSATLDVTGFLFDYVCCNRIVWGAMDVKKISIRHTAAAPQRFLEEVMPAIRHYSESSTKTLMEAINHAKAARLESKVEEFLQSRFTKSQVGGILQAFKEEEHRPIESLWDASVAVTAFAKRIPWQDERVKLEREGGKILDLAA
jgi:hypothetical protein